MCDPTLGPGKGGGCICVIRTLASLVMTLPVVESTVRVLGTYWLGAASKFPRKAPGARKKDGSKSQGTSGGRFLRRSCWQPLLVPHRMTTTG